MKKMKFFIICNVLNSFLFSGVVIADNTERRSHNHDPNWIDHCWDKAGTHLLDPFCQLLRDAVCNDPPQIQNGYYKEPHDNHFGQKVEYVCNDGYAMTGSEFIKCEKRDDGNMQWTQTPACVKTGCTDIPRLDNASFETPNNTNIGTVVSYTCNKGYELIAGNTIECLNSSEWSRPYPVCRIVCPSVPKITNGYSNGVTSTSIGTTVEYNCNVGYTIVDNNSTVCLYNNNTSTAYWSPLPECTEITCLPPHPTTYTEFVFNETTPINETTFFINDTVLYRCQPGLFFLGQVPDNGITGTPDTDSGNENAGTEVVYPTVEANDSENGDALMTTTEYSTTTSDVPIRFETDNETYSGNETYSNETGYTTTTMELPSTTITELPPQITEAPRPTQSMTCQLVGTKGVWTAMEKCAIDCGSIPNVDKADRTTPENTLVGAVVQYTCIRGYARNGPENVTCLNTGRWSDLPYCRPVCPESLVVNNSYITNIQYYSREKGAELYYVCKEGYTLEGPEVVTCIDTPGSKLPLNWSPAPFCRPACEIPAYINNGTRTEPENLLVGVTVTYTCDSDYHLKGPAVSTCLRWGNWTEVPECVHYCKVPPFVPNSKYETYSYTETEVVIFTCKTRYRLIGNDTLTCQNGTWSTPYPACECVVKPIDVVFIVDGSGSMGAGGFNKTLDFVADMVNRYPFDTTQFGLLVFSSNATPQFHLNQFTNNKTELINKIKSTKYPSGNTVTYDALEVARTDMFTEANGMRPNVSKIAIVVTDGKSGQLEKVSNQSQLLRNEGVTIYSVGVGATDQSELDSMASDQSFVFHVENYNAISAIEGPLAGVTCESLGDDELWSDDEDLWIV